jgi:hypothetical protein
MPEPAALQSLARKLLLRGLPQAYVRRAIGELAEHWEDLKGEALDAGLSLSEAEARATRDLGDAETLAATLAAKMQRGSWFGRHPILGFCWLPIGAILVWWLGFCLVAGWTSGAWQWSDNRSLPEPNWLLLQAMVSWCPVAAAAASPALFCWIATRSFRGFKWAFIACAIVSLHQGIQFARLTSPGSDGQVEFRVGYKFRAGFLPSNGPGFAIPWLVLGGFVLLRFRTRTPSPIPMP